MTHPIPNLPAGKSTSEATYMCQIGGEGFQTYDRAKREECSGGFRAR